MICQWGVQRVGTHSRVLRYVACVFLLIFLCSMSLNAQETKRVEAEVNDWIRVTEPRMTDQARRTLGTVLLISGLAVNIAPLAIGLPVIGIVSDQSIGISSGIAFGMQIGIGAAVGLFGGFVGLAADFSWYNFGVGTIIGSIVGVGGAIVAYTFFVPPPKGGTSIGLYTTMINAGLLGLMMWVGGLVLGGATQFVSHGVAVNGLRLNEDEKILVAFNGSQLLISY